MVGMIEEFLKKVYWLFWEKIGYEQDLPPRNPTSLAMKTISFHEKINFE